MKDIALLVVGAILGWIGQWLFYRYQQRDEQRQGPQVVISKVTRHGQSLCELRNIGADSLSEMDVNISWLQDRQHQHRPINQFFAPEQDERLASPTHVQLLGPNERYLAVGLPQSTDDGLVDIEVSGLGVKSQQPYNTHGQIDVALRHQA